MVPLVVESCHSTWLFDMDRMRFRRILRGPELSHPHATTAWRPFYGLEGEEGSDSFVVLLNPGGTRLLRSWRHLSGYCPSCGEEQTMELSADEMQNAAHS